MKMITFSMLVAWLVGVSLFAFGFTGNGVVIVTSLVLFLGFILTKIKRGFICIFIFLLGFGYCYAYSFNYIELARLRACDIVSPIKGVIVSYPRIKELQIQYHVRNRGGCLFLVNSSPWPLLYQGDEIIVRGNIQSVFVLREALPDYALYLQRKGFAGTASFANIELLSRGNTVSGHVRRAIKEKIRSVLVEPEASLAAAMLLAEEGEIPDRITTDFQRTGVSHILAISGQNITMLAAALLLILMQLPIHPWLRVGVLTALFWTYAGLLGMPVSAVRATYFATIILIALQIRALVSIWTVLILTACVMTIVDPRVVSDVGFQLSFAAMVGIGFSVFSVHRLPEPFTKYGLIELISVSIGASIATFPILAYHFGSFSIIGLLANLIIVPLFSVLMSGMVVILLTSFVSHIAAKAISIGIHDTWQGIDTVVSLFSGIPYAFLEGITMPIWAVWMYYLVLAFGLNVIVKKQGRSWRELWQ